MGPEGALAETIMLGLRLTSGLNLAALAERFEQQAVTALRKRAEPMVHAGLLRCKDDNLRLTPEGEALHTEIAARLI